MDRTVLLIITIVFGLAMLTLLLLGWRARRRRQSDVPAPVPAPADLVGPLERFAGKYVATTQSGQPLERIAVHGLGFRGPVTATVAAAGLLLQLPDAETWIPASDLRDLRAATWTIDRVVETDGLQLVAWNLGGREVDTYLRIDDARAFVAAMDKLLPERKPA